MRIHKLGGTDGFIVFDLDEAPHNVGITRLAPKILVDGATLLARSTTYLFASFEQQAGGASAGINARPEARDEAIAAYIDEVTPLVQAGTFLTEAGRGLTAADLQPLAAVDPRVALSVDDSRSLLGTSAGVAAAAVTGDLDGRSIAIEGLDVQHAGLLRELTARGARVVAVATGAGSFSDAAGIDVAVLADALVATGSTAIEALGESQPAGAVFGVEADVLFVGSKPGVIDHDVAASVVARSVVPIGPVPVTAKGLAVLRRAEVVVLPDFVTMSGPMFGSFPDEGETLDDVRVTVTDQVTGVLDDVLGHEDGPVLAACYRAEAFLRTWQDQLPFGRPLA